MTAPAVTFAALTLTLPPAGTALQLPGSPLTRGVRLKSLSTNSGVLYVGDMAATLGNGYELTPSESIKIAVDELSKVYVVASADGQKLCLLAT